MEGGNLCTKVHIKAQAHYTKFDEAAKDVIATFCIS